MPKPEDGDSNPTVRMSLEQIRAAVATSIEPSLPLADMVDDDMTATQATTTPAMTTTTTTTTTT